MIVPSTKKFYDMCLAVGDTWEIEAVLGFHFPTSALGLLVQQQTAPPPTDLRCYDVCKSPYIVII